MSVKMDKWCTLLLSSFLMQMGGQWTPLLGKAEMLRHMPQTGTEPGFSLVGSSGVAREFFLKKIARWFLRRCS
jgi:hypothetical protein